MVKDMKITLSTGNQTKTKQAKGVFRGSSIVIRDLVEAGISGGGIEERGPLATIEKNARIKARFAYDKTSDWSMADDTGVFVHALGGEPGVDAAHWGDKHGELEIQNYALGRMKGLKDRSGTFKTVVVIIDPQGKEYFFTGSVEGRFLEAPRCEPQKNMPYSAIFVPVGSNKVWAEMSVDEENAISHRGQAFRQALEFLVLADRRS
jgi:XTP/dITP diphosphohydrolase